jgi:hypothetical protein
MKKEAIWLRATFDFGFNMKGVRKLFKLELLIWQNNRLRDYVNSCQLFVQGVHRPAVRRVSSGRGTAPAAARQ